METSVYFQAEFQWKGFAPFAAPTLDQLRTEIQNKKDAALKIENPDNVEYWLNQYANLKIVKITETREIVE